MIFVQLSKRVLFGIALCLCSTLWVLARPLADYQVPSAIALSTVLDSTAVAPQIDSIAQSSKLSAPTEEKAKSEIASTVRSKTSPGRQTAESLRFDTNKVRSWFTRYPNSSVALLCSIIPGGGQLYNRRYWKIPIVLSAMAGGLYAVTWNQRTYKEYHTAYADLLSDNPLEHTSWQSFIPIGGNPEDYVKDGNLRSRLENGSKQFKQNRDLSIVVTVALYLLSALDAYVDAELYYFDVSPNLTIDMGDAAISSTKAPRPRSIMMGASIHF